MDRFHNKISKDLETRDTSNSRANDRRNLVGSRLCFAQSPSNTWRSTKVPNWAQLRQFHPMQDHRKLNNAVQCFWWVALIHFVRYTTYIDADFGFSLLLIDLLDFLVSFFLFSFSFFCFAFCVTIDLFFRMFASQAEKRIGRTIGIDTAQSIETIETFGVAALRARPQSIAFAAESTLVVLLLWLIRQTRTTRRTVIQHVMLDGRMRIETTAIALTSKACRHDQDNE